MDTKPQILYKSLKAWQEKGGEAEKEFVGGSGLKRSQIRLAWVLEFGVWGLPKLSGLETMIGFPQDRAESS